MFFEGILRRFLVWPTNIIWPQNLPFIAILRTLHERKSIKTELYNGGVPNRNWRNILIQNRLLFFSLIVLLTFIYQWFPLYIVPVLSVFSWICLINRKNYLLSQLTAVRGLALGGGGLTLDWSQVTMYLGSPLIVPGWALINIIFGFLLIIWLIVPIVYGANVRNLNSQPIGGIMFPGLTSMNLVTAFTSFACLPAVFVHTFLFHKSDLWNQFRTKNLNNMGNDMHARLMSLYKNVPDWWYFLIFVASFITICVVCDHSGWLKWYLVILSLFINAVLVLPFGLVSSITGQFLQNAPVYYLGVIISQGLSLGKESKQSYTFISVGYLLFVQTLALVQDMKLGHYLKIGHRPLFAAQCLAGFVCASLSIGIQYMYFNVYGLNNEFDSSFSIFDDTLIGGSVYTDNGGFFSDANAANRDLLWAFLVGAILPIPGWFLSRRTRFKWLRHLHWPLILVTISWMPALLSAGALFTWLLIGFTVYFTVGKYSWTRRHIYLTSGALDLGLNLTLIIVNTAFMNRERLFPAWKGTDNNNGWDSCRLALAAES
jgi:OPT family oligopeptide transporter